MGEKSNITWTAWMNQMVTTDRGGRRVRAVYAISSPRPTRRLRRQMAARGLKWCSRCEQWLGAEIVTHGGLCREHANQAYREQYAAGGKVAIAARVHARKRGVAPVPLDGAEALMEQFDGRCAYCDAPATTWDHIVPISAGGETVPWNIVPACVSCNSSKKARPLDEWLARGGRELHPAFIDVVALEFLPLGRSSHG